VSLPDKELNKLLEYEWPGNIRELKNVMERALIIQKGNILKPSAVIKNGHDISLSSVKNWENAKNEEIRTLEEIEKDHIKMALIKYENNYTQTAKALGISLSTLKRKLKNHQPNPVRKQFNTRS